MSTPDWLHELTRDVHTATPTAPAPVERLTDADIAAFEQRVRPEAPPQVPTQAAPTRRLLKRWWPER